MHQGRGIVARSECRHLFDCANVEQAFSEGSKDELHALHIYMLEMK